MSHPVEKIHILQIVCDPVGGIRKHVHCILDELDSDVFEQSYSYSELAADKRFTGEISRLQRSRLKTSLALPLRKGPHPSDLPNILALMRHIKKNRIRLVHGHGAKAGLYARVLGVLCGIPSVYTPHGGVVHNNFSPIQDFLYISVEKLLFSWTGQFIFESQYTASAFAKKIGREPKNSLVNYNGVAEMDLVTISSRSQELGYTIDRPKMTRIGVFGMLREVKGQLYALKALKILLQKNKNVSLVLFGDGPDLRALKNAATELGVNDHVTFAGDVNEPEAHMLGMDIILIPSLHESFGYVAVEAMALKKPVIATQVGGLIEVVDESTGTLIIPRDEYSIAEAIIALTENAATADAKAKNGYDKFLDRFTVTRMIDSLSKTYRNLIEARIHEH